MTTAVTGRTKGTHPMKRNQQRLAAFASLALAAGIGLSACGSDDDNGGGGDGGSGSDAIVLLPKNLGNAYFDASTTGAERAAGEFDGTIEEVGPDEATAELQVPFIDTAAQQGAGALVVSANDPSALCDSLNQARESGIKVVTFDSDVEADCRDLFVSQADAAGIAKAQVDLIAEQIDGDGEIAILSAAANATNQNEWISLMEEELAANYPDIELVDTVYGDDDDQKSFDQTEALLSEHPDLEGIISPTTVGISAAARYLSESDAKGEVALTGLGTPNQMREFVENGTVEAFALWNPEDLGYLAAYTAHALASGEIDGEEGDTFEAGDLGEYTVGADGVVLLGEPYVFTQRTSATSTSELARTKHRPTAGTERRHHHAPLLLHPPGPTGPDRRVRRAPPGRVARDARRARRDRVAQLLPVPAGGRAARRVRRVRRPRSSPGSHGPHRGQPRWQAEMADVLHLDDAGWTARPPTRDSSALREVFNLDDQLAESTRS